MLAGVCEIGGGYLVWQWWRNGAPWAIGEAGAVVLVLYGIVPTYQPAHFGRVHAAYGGVFVLLSMLWAGPSTASRPIGSTSSGAAICLVGVAVIMYWPREGQRASASRGSKAAGTAAPGVLLEEVSSPTAVIRINDFAIP